MFDPKSYSNSYILQPTRFKNFKIQIGILIQGSASGTESPGSRSPGSGNLGPGLILKSGTGTGTQIQNLRDPELGPGLKFEQIRDRDRDTKSENPGFGTGTQN